MREYLRTNGRERMMSEWSEGARYAGMLVPEILAAETETAVQAGSSNMTSSSQTERFLFYSAVCEFFHAASARNPLVIVLDDLQWGRRRIVAPRMRHRP